MSKLSDYVIDFVVSLGTKHVFVVTGGAIAHVVDALGRRADEKKDINYVCVQHEQAGAMAAEIYSRLGPGIGVAVATSGPGATNLITGICGCWFDSIPTLFITGQVNIGESVESIKTKPRQVGFQETDIVSIVKPITKYATQVKDPSRIKYELEKAIFIAKSGRPGPVLVDLPVDIQIADINANALPGFDPSELMQVSACDSDEAITQKILNTIDLINKSGRPIILLGGGIRISGAEKEAMELVEKLGFPVVVSWSGFDLIPHDHPQFVGHIGVYGHRGANFSVQNSDFLLSIGSRLDTRQTGGRVDTFAREAKSAMVDIDLNELQKNRGFTPTIAVCSDAGKFLQLFLKEISRVNKKNVTEWLERCKNLYKKYSAVLPEYKNQPTINAYTFIKALSDASNSGEIIISNEGGNLVWTMQAWEIKDGQRLISTFGNSPMGYAFPAAIGAAFALPGKQIICIDGDGGFQPNIQELQTLFHYKLPVKIFILNNRTMGIINQFQELYFEDRHYAAAPEGNYTMPDFVKVAKAYGIEAFSIDKPSEIDSAIKKVFDYNGPILCNVLIDVNQKLNPKLIFGNPIEDMYPYLPNEEFNSNMIIKPLPRGKQTKGWQKA